MDKQLSVEAFKQVVPKALKSSVTTELVDTINNVNNDEQLRDYYRDNLLGYSSVLNTGKFKLEDYSNAVKYVTYKLFGDTNSLAWTKTFPDRFERLVDKGVQDISPHVAAYAKNILVNRVMEQSMVPSYVANQDIHQRAINKLATIMDNDEASFKVQSDSASALLTHLKVPEAAKLEIDIGIKDSGAIEELKRTTLELARQQQALIEKGISAKTIAESKIIEGEIVE